MKKVERAIWGFIIGDAFGLPVEFSARDTFEIKKLEGYGYWQVPAGTWSDDTAMMLITAQHILERKGIDELKKNFCDWAYRGYWTYNGAPSFDVGLTISAMIHRWEKYGLNEQARTDEEANGNGALMRILPISIWTYKNGETEAKIKENAELTHGHIRSTLCCLHYTYLVHRILDGKDLETAYKMANEKLREVLEKHPEEKEHFKRLMEIKTIERKEINSTGYVLHTLEAVYWSLFHSKNYLDAISKAVHLGGDTDTIGAITGSLAAMVYEEINIPKEWFDLLPKKEKIKKLINEFNKKEIKNP